MALKKILFVLLFAATAISTLLLASCSEEPKEPEVTVSLSRVNVEMSVGDVYVLEASISPQDYESDISWSSSNPTVATCEGGVITALSPGRCHVTATLDNGKYFVSYVTVSEKTEVYMYMTVGETVELDRRMAPSLVGGVFGCTDTTVASCTVDGERVFISALKGGRSNVVITDGRSTVTVCEIVVLAEENSYNVTVDLPDAPIFVPYIKNSYSTGVTVRDIELSYDLSREYLDSGLVRVKLTFSFEKTYDSEGEDAENATGFTFEIYSGEKEGILRSYNVTESGISVNEGLPLTYEYEFDAVLDDGDGERSFTFVIVGAEKEENK